MNRLGLTDWLVGLGGGLLFISVFLGWFNYRGHLVGGFDATKLTVPILLFGLALIAMVVLRAREADFNAVPVAVLVIGMGVLALLVIFLRLFVHQKELGVSYGIFISLVAGAIVVLGGVRMLKEQSGRTGRR